MHAWSITPTGGVNPMLSAPPFPSSHNEGALGKLASRGLLARCRGPNCHRRSLAKASRG